MSSIGAGLRRVGGAAWAAPAELGRRVNLVADIVAESWRRLSPRSAEGARSVVFRLTVDQIWFTGVEAVPLVAALAAMVGVSLMGLGFRTLHAIGAESAFGTLLEQLIAIELAPLLTAIVVAARSGSAVCTELLAMRLADEMDALAVHGVPPWVYVGLPRAVGITVATAALAVVFAATTYGVTLLSTLPMGIALTPFLSSLGEAIRPQDVLILGTKGLLFGLAVATTTLHRGFTFGRDGADLPRVATRGIMDAMVAIFAIDAFFAVFV